MKKIIIIAVLVLIAVVGGKKLISRKLQSYEKLHKPKVYPVVLSTFRPQYKDVRLTLEGLGVVNSSTDVVLSTKLAAKVLYIRHLGEVVKKGDIVVRLDRTAIIANISSTSSLIKAQQRRLNSLLLTLKNAILTHKRSKHLLAVKGISIEQFQSEEDKIAQIKASIASVKSQIRSLKEKMKQLQNDLSYAVIRSPIDGMISKRFVNAGDMALTGKPLCEISSSKGKYLLLRLPDDVKPRGVIFNGRFYPVFSLHRTFEGLNEYQARIKTRLNNGERVKVGVVIFSGKAILLPFDGILSVDGKHYVFEYYKGRVEKKAVKVVAVGEEGVVIHSKQLSGKEILIAKPDILLMVDAGVPVEVKK